MEAETDNNLKSKTRCFGQFLVNGTQILDSPRFTHRGILLDSSRWRTSCCFFLSLDICRHYIAKSVIKDNLDLMEMNKFNVFHWHMTDDPSFPYVSTKFPNLRWFACRKRIHVRNIGKSKPPSKMGSFDEKLGVYTQQDVAEIIEYYNY